MPRSEVLSALPSPRQREKNTQPQAFLSLPVRVICHESFCKRNLMRDKFRKRKKRASKAGSAPPNRTGNANGFVVQTRR